MNLISLSLAIRDRLSANTRIRIADPQMSATAVVAAQRTRRAAVLLPLCLKSGVPSFLFTKRTDTLSTHKGQVSFPGGLIDKMDEGEIDTALREFHEETGLDRKIVTVLGVHHDACTLGSSEKVQTVLTPVVGVIGSSLPPPAMAQRPPLSSHPPPPHSKPESEFIRDLDSLSLRPNSREVAAWFTLPISYLLSPSTQRLYRGFPSFSHPENEELRIWGVTAWILHRFLNEIVQPIWKFEQQSLGRPT